MEDLDRDLDFTPSTWDRGVLGIISNLKSRDGSILRDELGYLHQSIDNRLAVPLVPKPNQQILQTRNQRSSLEARGCH